MLSEKDASEGRNDDISINYIKTITTSEIIFKRDFRNDI